MKKKTIAAAALVALMALPLFAQGRGGPGFLPMLHQLNLTDAQKDQITALVEAEHQAGPPKSVELERQLHAAIMAETPDLQAIETLKTSLNAAHAEDLDRRIEHLQKLAQILTPQQKQQLLSLEGHFGHRR